MADLKKRALLAATILVSCLASLARAADAPADPCSLLPTAQVSTALGKTYGAAQKSIAPRPYQNTVMGTDCNYSPNGAGKALLFRVYFDHSPGEATDLFAKLKMFYSPPTPVTGIGDEAYFDPRHGLHVRKGNVRYFLNLGNEDDFTAANQKQLTDLAGQVAAQL